MKTKLISTLSLSLMLSACATTQYGWDHPTNGYTQANTDKAQCKYSAVTATGNYSPNNRGGGIAQAMADSYDMISRRNEIFNLCMQSRGYSLRALT